MAEQRKPKKEWTTPEATHYGSVREITQQIKSKMLGSGDDVMIDSQLLSDVTS